MLVSQSPRRRELLAGLDIKFEACQVDINESYPEQLQGAKIPLYIARQKAEAFRAKLSDNMLAITADTVVLVNNQVLGKPHNEQEARKMLQLLSGKTHQVITGVCLLTNRKQRSFSACSKVTFATLQDEEIDYYLQKYKPYDKAGSYGVQEWIGYIGIKKLTGSYFNVMGLPVQRLYKELNNFI